MQLLNFESNAIWINLLFFATAACAVWAAGVRVVAYADAIARHTGIGRAVLGLVLLGGVTSLPEIAVAGFSAFAGNPALAVNNLLGGVAMQKAILAGVDGFVGKDALTVISASPAVLLQAALSTLVLVLVAVAIVAGDAPLAGVGVWVWAILFAYCFSIWKISTSEGRPSWETRDAGEGAERAPDRAAPAPAAPDSTLSSAIVKTSIAAAVIFAAGFLLSRAGAVLATQTGLGQNLAGAVLLALATSLPEISTVTAAMRLRQYEMAIADILGTNLFNVMLIFLVDVVFRGDPVLNLVGDFSLLASLLCILMATIYLIGLIERRNRTIARFGVDSIAILVSYIGGLFLLYQLR
jgi:cation:H+ antiporter